MIVTCPDCATRYRVDDAAFSDGGRAVRCNHCRCEWYQIGPSTAPNVASEETDALELSAVQINTRPNGGGASRPTMGLDRDRYGVEHDAPDAGGYETDPLGEDEFDGADEESLDLSGVDYDQGALAGEPASASLSPDYDSMIAAAKLAAEFGADDRASKTDDGLAGYSDEPMRFEGAKGFSERHAPEPSQSARSKADGFVAHSVPVVVESDSPRAMGVSSGRRASRGGGGARAALLSVVAAPVGFYYFGPQLKQLERTAAPAATPVVEEEQYRDQVDSVFATSATAASVAVNEGVVFVDYKYDLVERAEGPALEVWGRVANNGPQVELTPTIEIVSRDEDGQPLQRWLARPETDQLKPGESARFASRMMYPRGPVFDVDLYIASQ